MKIWILTSGFGSGHRSAAGALEEEYRRRGHEVEVSDIVELLYPKRAALIYDLFSRVICRHSWLYNGLNQFGRGAYEDPKTPAVLQQELDRICPDKIVTTWSGCGRKLGKLDIPVEICITDVGIHTGWLYPYAESYRVATEESAEQLKQLGVPAEKIRVRGIPVKEAFRSLPEKTKGGKRKNLLIMGGGLGIIPWLDGVLKGLSDAPNVQITVVAGKNKALYQRLKRDYPSVETVGFVTNIPEYLARADFLISKPGGISLFESIHASTPYIAMCPAYEHELENAAFIEKHGLGMVVRHRETAGRQIRALLADRKRCRICQMNVAQLKRNLESTYEEDGHAD